MTSTSNPTILQGAHRRLVVSDSPPGYPEVIGSYDSLLAFLHVAVAVAYSHVRRRT